jgi:glycine dehydrogenase
VTSASVSLRPTDDFPRRHVGPDAREVAEMLATLGLASLDELVAETVPASIRSARKLALPEGLSESECLAELRAVAGRNKLLRSYLGMGYHGTLVPAVIQRNVLENPGWYTQYTPYQAEISQGRLEALLDFQTMVVELTGMELANASMLDEGTAAAEAMAMCRDASRVAADRFLVSVDVHPQTLAVVRVRAEALGIEITLGDAASHDFAARPCFGVLLQYPETDGRIEDPTAAIARAQAAGALAVVATDLLALCLLRPPGELGADVAVGSAQRFGVPMGYGGPHAAFLATKDALKRSMPGRLIGVSKDAQGNRALRMSLQTREQHIRREKATSNICTAQVLLAVMAGMYAVYHGPEGLRAIAERVHGSAAVLAAGLEKLGCTVVHRAYFDTLRVRHPKMGADDLVKRALQRGINVRKLDASDVGVALDETVTRGDLEDLLAAFGWNGVPAVEDLAAKVALGLPAELARVGPPLRHPVFSAHRSEHEMLRYLRRLESRDLSLTTSMIPLGSCTMKLNATSEMLPVTWPEFGELHPFAPRDQARGYLELFTRLEHALQEITGFDAVSLQPNAGSQGEYAGLLVIRAWHREQGQGARDVCLIPTSAHGTNPASAVMAGLRVVAVACDERGNVDLADLGAKAAAHAERLACLMITYPSTHGVFEESIREICDVVHRHGGQVYMDGANMNAQVGLCRPGEFGPDVCHLNLHKTFCIPHGGGGPGMGPIAVKRHLAPFLPGHPVAGLGGERSIGPVSSAPWGSASILTISQVYIAMMGGPGLTRATEIAILNANYMAARLRGHYSLLFSGARGRVAHEFIVDLRPFEHSAGVLAEDVAKRLMDYGFHAPTMSFPVAGTLMIEPTESEPKAELDRLCDALIAIRGEIRAVEEGRSDRNDNPLKHAPHTALVCAASEWKHAYSRELAAFPAPWSREHKFWPHVGRVDNGWGDRNLFCTCPPVESYAAAERAAPPAAEAAPPMLARARR